MSADDAKRTCAAARESAELPALAVAAASGGNVVFAEARGEADLEHHLPVAADGVFEIASVTKLFTAEAVMVLVQDSVLSLDQTPDALLPEVPDAWRSVPLERILAHQSGLPSYTEADGYRQGAALNRGREGILELVAGLPLLFEPGERHAYDNTGFHLLGTVIERVSGRSHETFLNDRIIRPLGLRATRVNDYRELVPGRVHGYSRDREGIVNKGCYSTSNTFSAGVLLASAPDLAAFGAAAHTDALLAPALRRAMRTPRPSRVGNELSEGFQVGLGWFLTDDGTRRFEGHGGGILGFRSALIHLPAEELCVAVLANGDWWERPEDLALEVARCLT